MNREQEKVAEFHTKYRCASSNTPLLPDSSMLLLRSRLIMEETAEFVKAASQKDFISMIDALCDILYVVYGTAVVMGVDLEPFFAEVHRSNMTKDGGGQDSAGKVIKGPNYTPPKLESILEAHRSNVARKDPGEPQMLEFGGQSRPDTNWRPQSWRP